MKREGSDHETYWPTQVELLMQLVEIEADSRIARGVPGAWAEVAGSCRRTLGWFTSVTACDPKRHFYWMELQLWSKVLPMVVRSERQEVLREALERHAALASPEDPETWERLLRFLHPELGARAVGSLDSDGFARIELRFFGAFEAFRKQPSASSLRACLAIASELARAVEALTGHRPCTLDPYLAGEALVEALTELLPLVHRVSLGRLVESLFFRLYGEGEEPLIPGEIPRTLWRQLRTGEVVAPVYLRLGSPELGSGSPPSGSWFVDELEEALFPYEGWSWGQLRGVERPPEAG